jgi:ribosomal protein S18 acetylase RimI-like enzyme
MEENLHEHVSFVQRRVAGMTVEDRADLLLVDSGLASDTFNKICRARLAEDEADARIGEALEYFRANGRPFTWWVGPLSRPADLGARLEAQGLRPAERELGMCAAAGELKQPDSSAEGLAIRRVRTLGELRDFAAVNADNWWPPDAAVTAFFESAADMLLREECPMRLFVGYVDGVAAAASELFLSGSTAGVHMVSTRRAFRRRGIGLRMTWAAVEEGLRCGSGLATLQASEEGRGVYERLGFRACGQFVEYALGVS